MTRRVVVTGLGAVTPLGNDVPTLWEGLLAGRSGVGPITLFDPSHLEVRIAAEVKDFDPVALLGRRQARRSDRFTFFALEAARQAVADAGLQIERGDGREVGAQGCEAAGHVEGDDEGLGVHEFLDLRVDLQAVLEDGGRGRLRDEAPESWIDAVVAFCGRVALRGRCQEASGEGEVGIVGDPPGAFEAQVVGAFLEALQVGR